MQYNDEHSFKVSVSDVGCYNLFLSYQGYNYTFVQMHFHSVSEHTFGSGFYSAEAHLVHYNPVLTQYIVLGIQLDVDGGSDVLPRSNNTFLNNLWTTGGSELLTEQVTNVTNGFLLNPYTSLLPSSPNHFRYSGSLTTPPCTEAVEWFVYHDPVRISWDDLNILRAAGGVYPDNLLSQVGNSNRPVQTLNTRVVSYVTGETTTINSYVENDDDNNLQQTTNISIILASIAFVLSLLSFAMIFIQFITGYITKNTSSNQSLEKKIVNNEINQNNIENNKEIAMNPITSQA